MSFRVWLESRDTIPFYHSTDVGNILKIAKDGIKPSTASAGEAAVYFLRNPKYIAQGSKSFIGKPIILHGEIPIDIMDRYGIVDDDYALRIFDPERANFRIYNYPQDTEETFDQEDWRKSYYYTSSGNDSNYGGAGITTTIPPEWIKRVNYHGRWFNFDEFLNRFGKALQTREKEREFDQFLNLGLQEPHQVRELIKNRDKYLKVLNLYQKIRDLIPEKLNPEIAKYYEDVFKVLGDIHGSY